MIAFCDLRAAWAERATSTEEALLRVARSGQYVLGEEVAAFEHDFACLCGVSDAIGVGNGTDALALILRAAGIGPGDEVVVPAQTAPATWIAVTAVGAEPVGADVDPVSGLIDVAAVQAAVGQRTRAVIAVHLFGRVADVGALRVVCGEHGLLLIEDAAHAAGVDEGQGPAGSLADAAAFSFYPTKTLGGIGDGGAVVTGDAGLADAVRRLRSYGWSEWQEQIETPGVNSRLDELQAAVLRARLAELPAVHARLRELGTRYRESLGGLSGVVVPPLPASGEEPPWHQFVLRCSRREELRRVLDERGIGTAVHYEPIPPDLRAFGCGDAFPVARELAARSLSLPFDSWLTDAQVSEVCEAVLQASGS